MAHPWAIPLYALPTGVSGAVELIYLAAWLAIQPAILSRAAGAMVSSRSGYSAGKPIAVV